MVHSRILTLAILALVCIPFMDATIIELTRANYQKVIAEKKPLIIDFYADWCRPCQNIKPAYEKVAQELGSRYTFAKVNTDSLPELVNEYGIIGIPTFVVLIPNQPAQSFSGANLTNPAALKSRIEVAFAQATSTPPVKQAAIPAPEVKKPAAKPAVAQPVKPKVEQPCKPTSPKKR